MSASQEIDVDVRVQRDVRFSYADPIGWEADAPPAPAFTDVEAVDHGTGASVRATPVEVDGSRRFRLALMPGRSYWLRPAPSTFWARRPRPPHADFRVPARETPRLDLWTARWLPDRRGHRRFLLGVNYEALRRQNGHDLAPNDFLPGADHAWVDEEGHLAAMEQDLDRIAAMGVNTIRVWLGEQMEGLRAHLPQEALGLCRAPWDELERDAGLEHMVRLVQVTPPEGRWHAVTTRHEFERLAARWGGSTAFRIDPMNPVFARLCMNALALQRAAHLRGLQVVWTLWTHYQGAYPLGPSLVWEAFLADGQGRLPVDAWIRRWFMVECLDAYLEGFVAPLVRALAEDPESGDAVLAIDVMNEPNNNWRGSRDRLARLFSAHTSSREWLLSTREVTTFLKRSADTVRRVAPHVPVVTPIALAHDAAHELQLADALAEEGAPLTATTVTRYAKEGDWASLPHLGGESPDAAGYLRFAQRRTRAALLLEAGQRNLDAYDGEVQRRVVEEAVTAALTKGWAGIFLWHFGSPTRGDTEESATRPEDQLMLIEGLAKDGVPLHRYAGLDALSDSERDRPFRGHRPAARWIMEMSARLRAEGILTP